MNNAPTSAHSTEGRPIGIGDFVLPVTAPAPHFAYLLLVVDPPEREGHHAECLWVQLAFPDYVIPPGFEYLPQNEQDRIREYLNMVSLVPVSSVVHHEDAGLILVSSEAKRRILDAIDGDLSGGLSSSDGSTVALNAEAGVKSPERPSPAERNAQSFTQEPGFPVTEHHDGSTTTVEYSRTSLNNHDLS